MPADSLPSIGHHLSITYIKATIVNHMSSHNSVNTSISSDSPCSLASFSFSQIFSLSAPSLSLSSITYPFSVLFSLSKVSFSRIFYLFLSFIISTLPLSFKFSSLSFLRSILERFSSYLYFMRSFSSYSLKAFTSFACFSFYLVILTIISFFSRSSRLFSS